MILLLFRFDIMSRYPVMRFMVDMIINCVSLMGIFDLFTNRILPDVLEYFRFRMLFNRSLGAYFSNGLEYQHALQVLEWCFEKSESTQRYVTVFTYRPFGRGVTTFLYHYLVTSKIEQQKELKADKKK